MFACFLVLCIQSFFFLTIVWDIFVHVKVLVLAPTREIAHQIHNVITAIGQEMKSLKCSLFIGGMPMQHDVENAKLCHIAIGTPG